MGPVHGEEGVDAGACVLRGGKRYLVDKCLRARGVGQCVHRVHATDEREPGMVGAGEAGRRNLGEHCVGLLATAEPRQIAAANDVRLGSAACTYRRFRQSIGERQIGQPHRAVGGPDEQVRVRFEIRVQTQRRAPHDGSHVVSVIAVGEFGGDSSAQSAQPDGRRAFAAYLAVKRMRHPCFDPAVDAVELDEPAHHRPLRRLPNR